MDPKNICVALIIGSQSEEHKISLISSVAVFASLKNAGFQVKLIGIDIDGTWRLYTDDYLMNSHDPNEICLNRANSQELGFSPGHDGFFYVNNAKPERLFIDVAFPLVHGSPGEDGTIQGFLKMFNMPCVGCDLLSSALCMDKDYAKRLLIQAGIATAPYKVIKMGDQIDYDLLKQQLGMPLFVKPASQGSSVGVSCASTVVELKQSIALAFEYEPKIVVETAIVGRELECAVLGSRQPSASVVGEIKNDSGFYSYAEKYLESNLDNLVIPADIPSAVQQEIQRLAVQVFNVLSCHGMARVDFFLSESGALLVNEVNTIPGFTSISMYPSLRQEGGQSIEQVMKELITIALSPVTSAE